MLLLFTTNNNQILMSDKITVTIDTSELDDYQLCNYKHYVVHDLGLRPKDPNWTYYKNMDGGSLMHYYLEIYYILKRDTYKPLPEIIEEVIDRGRIKALDFLSLEPTEVTDTNFHFREYCRYYANENWIPIYVEKPFIFKFYEDDEIVIYLTGKPDLVFKYLGTNHIGVCDHKKSKRVYSYSQLRNQFALYAIAMETDTVIVNKVGFQKTLKVEERMTRQSFVFRQELLDEWRTETVQWIKMLVLSHQTNYHPRNRTSCEKWNGCFLERWCTTRPEAREFLIGSEYITGEKWDVTKILETK